jgi:hypothetical protein
MARSVSPLTLIVSALVCLPPAAPALAQRARVFVASYGSDTNPCTFGSPCKTFQNAVNVVATGGEVTAIDSAGFGPININHAVTITSPNGVEAGVAAPAAGDAAITVNAPPTDLISLNGLTLDGDGVPNTSGIVFNNGGRLEIKNTVIRNFGIYGINFASTANTASQLSVSNTLIADTSNGPGISISETASGPVTGVLKRVTMINSNASGLSVQTAASSAVIAVTVTDSTISNNDTGIFCSTSPGGGKASVMVRNSTIANNSGDGVLATGTNAAIRLARSTISENATGWAVSGSGTVATFGDNNIIGNVTINTAPATKPALE